MLQPIAVGHKSLADYTHLAGKPLIEDIRELAEDLEGLRVLHLSATAFGGGVAEILYTLIPLMNDVGIEAEWQVMLGREEFYNVTKRLHNALQGNPDSLSEEEWKIFERYNALNATEISGRMGRDHRPRPPARGHPRSTCRRRAATGSGAATSTCPLRTRTPSTTWCRSCASTTTRVFHLRDYVPAGMDGARDGVRICPPAIDPLSPKNMALSPEDAAYVCDQFGIDVDRPLMCQVSRFDPWKDPIGVIDAYREVNEADARGPAGAGGLDGHSTTPRAGSSSTRRWPTPTATPTSTSSTTSTTSGRSRSTRSSRRPTW